MAEFALDRRPDSRRSGTVEAQLQSQLTGLRLGRYRLGERFGLGGAASVYVARLCGPHRFERLVAVKVIHDHLAEDPEFRSMFLDEANLASRLSHPNLVHLYELGESGQRLFLAMELLHGQPLSNVYRAVGARGGRLPWDVVAWIGARAAEGLHYAHELKLESGEPLRLVHRDVSPDNIFVTYAGHVKVIDFGIARALHRLTTTALGCIKGKFRYMAPEQALGRPYDHRADLFALAATLLEAGLGRPVFDAEEDTAVLGQLLLGQVPNPFDLDPELPPALGAALLSSLSPEPGDRPENAGVFAHELDSCVRESGRTDQRERLEELMETVFSDQRTEQARAIEALRRLDPEEPSDAATSSALPLPQRHSQARIHRWLLGVVILLAVGVAGAGAALRQTPHGTREVSQALGSSQSLEVELEVLARQRDRDRVAAQMRWNQSRSLPERERHGGRGAVKALSASETAGVVGGAGPSIRGTRPSDPRPPSGSPSAAVPTRRSKEGRGELVTDYPF